MSDRLRVIVIADNADHAIVVLEQFRSSRAWPDAELHHVSSYADALAAFHAQRFDVALVDYWLAGGKGPDLVREIRSRGIDTPAIVVPSGDDDVAVEAMKAGAVDYLSRKALTVESLDRAVRYALALSDEVAARRKVEEELRQSQKLEAVGKLAGGVAHDFNNLLTAILGYTNLVLEDLPKDAPTRRDLEEIRIAGERAAALTRQLLAFSRRQMLQPQVVDLNELVRRMEKLLRRSIAEDVELVSALAPGVRPVRIDPASIEQVIVNLAVNARDAMPTGGRLTIETANVQLDGGSADADGSVAPGAYVMLALVDTGHGMDRDTRTRIFEPFFTTREHGKGSGLGLATVYGIVKQSGGHIRVDSESGRGATFRIYLPAIEQPTARPSVPEQRSATRGWETILLVEDEDAVRALAGEILRRSGYRVLEARHGVDALGVAERYADEIHLTITDVVMPHMSGPDLLEMLAAARPRMKVLFISGYTDHAVVHREMTPTTHLLQKPFTPDALARKVRSVLDGGSPASQLN